MDVKKEGKVIIVSKKDYAKGLEKVDIRKGLPDDPLTEVEMKMYRNMWENCLG